MSLYSYLVIQLYWSFFFFQLPPYRITAVRSHRAIKKGSSSSWGLECRLCTTEKLWGFSLCGYYIGEQSPTIITVFETFQKRWRSNSGTRVINVVIAGLNNISYITPIGVICFATAPLVYLFRSIYLLQPPKGLNPFSSLLFRTEFSTSVLIKKLRN